MLNLAPHATSENGPLSQPAATSLLNVSPESASSHSVHEGIWITNAELATTFVNSRMTTLLGYRTEEMMGRPLADFVDDADRAAVALMFTRLQANVTEAAEICLRHRDGAPLMVVLDLRALSSAEAEFKGVRASVIDVTAQRTAEQQLKECQARVIELEGRLQRAERMSRLGSMAVSVADELNSILTGIQSFSEMILRDGASNDRTYEAAARIADGVAAGQRATQEILRFAHTPEPVQPREGDLPAANVPASSTFHVLVPSILTAGRLPLEPLDVAPITSEPLCKLLLVEDDPAVALGLVTLLEMDEIEVALVTHGSDAVKWIDAFSPDAVVLDVGLPDISGIAVYEQIARRWPSLPVLFSTGSGDEKLLTHVLAKPNVGYLQKPYDGESLLRAVGRLRRSG
jgi:PAS domain S-box-containing protein